MTATVKKCDSCQIKTNDIDKCTKARLKVKIVPSKNECYQRQCRKIRLPKPDVTAYRCFQICKHKAVAIAHRVEV